MNAGGVIASEPRLQFFRIDELDSQSAAQTYDAVFCMEVLEHVVDWEPELARIGTPACTRRETYHQRSGRDRAAGAREANRSVQWPDGARWGTIPGRRLLLVRACFGRGGGKPAASRAAGLRDRQRSSSRSQGFQLDGAPRSASPSVRARACCREPFLVARTTSRHSSVVCLPGEHDCDRPSCRPRLRLSGRAVAQHGSHRRHADADVAGRLTWPGRGRCSSGR